MPFGSDFVDTGVEYVEAGGIMQGLTDTTCLETAAKCFEATDFSMRIPVVGLFIGSIAFEGRVCELGETCPALGWYIHDLAPHVSTDKVDEGGVFQVGMSRTDSIVEYSFEITSAQFAPPYVASICAK